MEDGTGIGPDGEVIGIALGVSDKTKLLGDEGSGMFYSDGSFEGDIDGNLKEPAL